MSFKRAHDLSELADGVPYCRAFGHSWANPSHRAFKGKGHKPGWNISLVCGTCGTEKHFQLSHRGELTKPRYIYPERYLASFFIGPEERQAFRLEALGLPPAIPALRSIEGGKAG